MSNNKLSLTVGIPAYNEEQNIEYLIQSIINQKQKSFNLKKILVLSDGSTDKTDFIVKKLQKKFQIISLISDGQRKGHMKRLAQLYTLNSSDILIQVDADVQMGGPNVIENIIKKFKDNKVMIVSGDTQPVVSETYFESLMNVWHKLWTKVREEINKGDTILNCNSAILAMRNSFVKSIKLPTNIISSGRYIYCLVKQKKYKFCYVPKSIIYFRLAPNFHDYFLQNHRYSNELDVLKNIFGADISEYYKVPKELKYKAVFSSLSRFPLKTTLAALVYLINSVIPKKEFKEKNNNLYQIAVSTKRGLKPISF